MSKANAQAQSNIQLLDGAMGTTLEALGYDVSGPMWGSDLLHSDSEAIARVHRGYVGAGADLIETATYQMSLDALLSDHNRIEAEKIMRRAIILASDPRSPDPPLSTTRTRPGVVLSLGPYGATLSPSQEYAGIYPPPYGPLISSSNAFQSPDQALEAVDALTTWHLNRLQIYAGDEGTWRKVEWIGFETVPLLTEVTAIRKAMGLLRQELRGRWGGHIQEGESGREWWDKRFWISSAYPNGQHPQLVSDGHASVDHILAALISTGSDSKLPPADGIGINCTHPTHIASLTRQSTESMKRLHRPTTKPTFVLYPDGGAVYDTRTRTWTDRTTRPEEWARGVCAVARELEGALHEDGSKVWDGVVVGGCCKAGFKEIEYLRKELDR